MPEFRLGKYQLLVEIARGGMGIVYVAAAEGPGGFSKTLILKELNPELAEDPTFLSMFLEEARLAARLDHPNIVQTLEVGQDRSRHYIAMEYLQGQTLARIRRKRVPEFDVNVELRVMCDVLEGLHYAHTLQDYDDSNLGLVHRDVSPQNIFLTYDGLVKVVDFGVAKAADSRLETKAGTIKGKAGYLPPEALAGSTLDARADIFAVGVMIWEVVANRRLWTTKNEVEILGRLLKGDIPKLVEAKPDASPELIRICDKAIAANPDDRYPSAEAMRNDIEAFLTTAGKVATPREIGAMVATSFRPERDALRAVIEAQRQELRRGALSRPQLAQLESQAEAGTPSGGAGPPVAGSLGAPSTSGVSATGLNSTRDATPTPNTRRLLLGGAVAAVAVCLLLLYVVRSSMSAKQAAVPPPPPPSAAEPTAPPPPPMPTAPARTADETIPTFAVVMRVMPSNAMITLNGQRTQNPLATRCTRGASMHFVMTAPGFAPMTRDLVCDSDLTLDLGLERQVWMGGLAIARPPPPVASVAPPASARPASTPAEVGTPAIAATPAGRVPAAPSTPRARTEAHETPLRFVRHCGRELRARLQLRKRAAARRARQEGP